MVLIDLKLVWKKDLYIYIYNSIDITNAKHVNDLLLNFQKQPHKHNSRLQFQAIGPLWCNAGNWSLKAQKPL